MRATQTIEEVFRAGCIACLGLSFLLALAGTASAQKVNIGSIYVQGDTLKLDATLDSLFSRRTLDAIESGMTTSIVIQFRLESDGTSRVLERTLALRLEHDIWEGHYRIVRYASTPDTLHTADFNAVVRYCTDLSNTALGTLPDSDPPYVLLSQIEVNPISSEQQQRTRKWLNILEEGSLLEFFISLDRPSERTRWIEIKRFHPNSLPRFGSEKRP